MIKKHITLIIILPLFAFTCVSKKMREKFIEVHNKMDKNIYCVPNFNYPDTSLSFTSIEKIMANDSIYYLTAQSSKKLFYMALCKKEFWQKMVTSGTLQIFVFDENVLKKDDWNNIVAEKKYLRRLSFNYDDILKNDCKIVVE
jgi:hypothetical protein